MERINKALKTIKYADKATHKEKSDRLDRQANIGSGESAWQ